MFHLTHILHTNALKAYLSLHHSVSQSCQTLCDPINLSRPVFPVHHQLQGPAQTHVHRVSDTLQASHSLSSPSPPAFNLPHVSNFIEEISSLSHSVVFLYFFALITEEGFFFYLSLLFFGTLHSKGITFLFFFAFRFSSFHSYL